MESELMKQMINSQVDAVFDKVQDINVLERHFGRSLSSNERQIVLDEGKQALLDKLGLDEEDYFTMQRAFALISAGFTESSERYDYELEQNNYKALDLFKSLVNDLECIEAERHKVRIGRKEDLGTKIKVMGEDAGYREDKDPELDTVFKDADGFKGPNPPSEQEQTKQETNAYNLGEVFAAETKCDNMHITGDTYEEDDKAWEEKYPNTDTTLAVTVDKAIERLDKGCELELDDDVLDAVIDKLWNERDNVSIKIHNNKISIR